MLKLYLLGPPRIELGETAVDLRRRKAIALLIYVVVTAKLHSRDALATLFYPDYSQSRARAYLRRDLAALNGSLYGDWLEADRDSVILKPDADVWVDVVRFRECRAAVEGHEHPAGTTACPDCLSLLTEAVNLYQADFLEGFTLRDCPDFDEWQFFQAESLRQELALALDQLVEGLSRQGDHTAAIPQARRRVGLDPLHEPAQRQLMQLYAGSGQQAAALRQYEEFVRLLEAEFGVPPEEETTTLFEAIKGKRIVAPLLKEEEQRRTQAETPDGQLAKRPPIEPQPPASTTETPVQLTEIGPDIPFIGRAAEYAQLASALERAIRGESNVVLVEGESGIGKSRLVEELRRNGWERGINSLSGKCYETEQALPYQVVIHLIDKALTLWPLETIGRLSPAYVAEIARLVPELAHQFPDLPPPSGLKEAQQSRLFRALTQLLALLAEPAGLVLIIDDIQWADRITRQFLNHLVYHLESAPILLIAVCRSEEMAVDEELLALVQAWQRQPHVSHLSLEPLTPADARRLVEQFLESPAQVDTLAQRLYEETDGHPFFLVCILQSLAEQGLQTSGVEPGWFPDPDRASQDRLKLMLPDALRRSVRGRLRDLPKATKAVLELVAVYGRHFDFHRLQAITPLDQNELLDILEDLVTRQLWRELESGGAYDFRHDKIREVVYHDLSTVRRVLLHRQVAEAVEKLPAGTPPGLLADHFEKGEVWDKAVNYLSRSADQAAKLFAMAEAADFYDRALRIVENYPDLIDAPTRFRLVEGRGEARAFAGQLADGIADLEQVLQFAQSLDDQAWALTLLVELGQACRKADRLERAIRYLTDALKVAQGTNDELAVADVLFHLGTTSYSAGEYHQSAHYHQQAVDICDRLGNIDSVAVQAYHGRGEAYFSTGHPAAAIDYYEKSLAMARQVGDKNYEAENLQMMGFAYSGLAGVADYQRSLDVFTESLAISQKLGLDWLNWASYSGWAYALGCTGDYALALLNLEHHIDHLEAIEVAPRYLSMAYDLYGDLLRELNLLEQAGAAYRRGLEIASEVEVYFWHPRLQANLAINRLRFGDSTGEDDLLAALASTARAGAVYHEVRCLEGLAELYLALDRPETTLEHANYLLAAATPGGMREVVARAHRWRGEALLALQDFRAAELAGQQAAELEQEIGRPRLTWDIHDLMARVHRQQGDRAAADEQEQIVASIVAKLAGQLTEDRWRTGLPGW